MFSNPLALALPLTHYSQAMVEFIPALPGSPSQRLGWMSLDLIQQLFLYKVCSSYNTAYRTADVLLHIVPRPMMTISGSPRNTSFFQGLNLVFTCNIILEEAVDTSVTVQGTWNRNESELVNEGRITISNPPLIMHPYLITVSFSPLNVSDAGTYECNATVTPQDTTFVTGSTSSISRNISVAGRA